VSVNRMNGSIGYYSYRDPNLAATLDVFNGTSEFLTTNTMTPDDIRKAVISTIGAVDAPMSPDTKGYPWFWVHAPLCRLVSVFVCWVGCSVVSTTRYLVGITDADVQQRRNEVMLFIIDIAGLSLFSLQAVVFGYRFSTPMQRTFRRLLQPLSVSRTTEESQC
jgi:hypothetical protein